MTVRYQAIGRIVDGQGKGVVNVEAVLLLEPPPPDGPQLDALFLREGMARQLDQDGSLSKEVGPAIGLSDTSGAFLVRVTGRLGSAHAIRLGLDRSGRPPFETAWLVLRKAGRPDMTRTVSILGWQTSPDEWGKFANRLPTILLPGK